MEKLVVKDIKDDPIGVLFNEKVIDTILTSDIVLIPNKVYRDNDSVYWTFPEGTNQFYNYLINKSDNKLGSIDIAESDNISEFQKHHYLLELATIVVTALDPILINVISSFIYDFLSIRKKKPDEIEVKLEVIQKGKTKTVSFEYRGSAADFKSTMESIKNFVDE